MDNVQVDHNHDDNDANDYNHEEIVVTMMSVYKIMIHEIMFRCHGPCLWLKEDLQFSRMERFFW